MSRSSASLRSSQKRRKLWLQWRSQKHALVPSDRLWLLVRAIHLATKSPGMLGRCFSGVMDVPRAAGGRQRDIFPLVVLDGLQFKPDAWTTQRWKVLLIFINSVVRSLNHLYGARTLSAGIKRLTSAQHLVICQIVERSVDFLCRLESPAEGTWEQHVPYWVPLAVRPAGLKYGNLQADRVDVLPSAGLCDPLHSLPSDMQKQVCDAKCMFPAPPAGLHHFEDVSSDEREEYVKLVARQLRCGQLGLCSYVQGGGKVIGVGKPVGARQRAVWNGRRVSQAAARPPVPNHLASPTALTLLECTHEAPVRVSKRDANCWFDQLALPRELRPWMGRPAVTVHELKTLGCISEREILRCIEDGEPADIKVYFPVSRTWPMGFSFSSYVAQEYLLSLCSQAGMTKDNILACDSVTPLDFNLCFAAATDDVMIFSTGSKGTTLQAANRLDDIMADNAVTRQETKDVNDQLDATCVGVNIERGMFLGVPGTRCLAMLVTLCHLLAHPFASAKQLQQHLGTQQWYDLLCRPKLSVYNEVYKFTENREDVMIKLLPVGVLFELALGFVLGIFWRNDLRRPFLPLLSATDASCEFGFGACVAQMPISMIRRIARHAEKRGAYVMLNSGRTADYASRLGCGIRVDISFTEFTDIFSVRKRFAGHINLLEGHAFLLWLRWLLRTRRHHSKRVVVLVDSAVWLGAAAKGRSSTKLNRLLRKAAALEMAGDVQVHMVLVPSLENPSDAASRGVRRRRSTHRTLRTRHVSSKWFRQRPSRASTPATLSADSPCSGHSTPS